MVAQATSPRPGTATDDDVLVALRGVDKRYANGTLALHDVGLEIHRHEFVTLVGPSGCGKSTVLRIVAGLGQATSGTVLVENETPERARRKRNETAFVFQDPTLLPWLTVKANAELPLKLHGVGRRERRRLVEDKLALVGLEAFADAYPRELSGGMRMRVSIARALSTEPKLLLMDEPFGALDEITRQRMNDDLTGMWQAARCTILFVTHNVFEAVFLSTRIVVMSSRPGRIVAEFQIREPYPRPPEFRTSPEFTEIARQVFAALKEA